MRWLKLQADFFTHRKTLALRNRLGRDAYWIPLRILAEAALCWPDGILEGIPAATIAGRIDYPGDPAAMIQALIEAGFLDPDPLRIHDWAERQAFHAHLAARAKSGAAARWSPPLPPSKKRGEESTKHGVKHGSSMGSSIGELSKRRTAKERLASQLLDQHSLETANGRQWTSRIQREEWRRLQTEIRDLDRQMAKL